MFSGHYAFPNDYANAQRSLPQIHRYYTCNLVYRALCFVYLDVKKQNKYNLRSVQNSLNRNKQMQAQRDFPDFSQIRKRKFSMKTRKSAHPLSVLIGGEKQNSLKHNWQKLPRCHFPYFLNPETKIIFFFAYMWTGEHCDWLWFLMKIRKTRKSAHPFPVLIGGETLPDCCWVQA